MGVATAAVTGIGRDAGQIARLHSYRAVGRAGGPMKSGHVVGELVVTGLLAARIEDAPRVFPMPLRGNNFGKLLAKVAG